MLSCGSKTAISDGTGSLKDGVGKHGRSDEPNAQSQASTDMLMCEKCTFGTSDGSLGIGTIPRLGCGKFVGKLFQIVNCSIARTKPRDMKSAKCCHEQG